MYQVSSVFHQPPSMQYPTPVLLVTGSLERVRKAPKTAEAPPPRSLRSYVALSYVTLITPITPANYTEEKIILLLELKDPRRVSFPCISC
jgi:hypothetical protein